MLLVNSLYGILYQDCDYENIFGFTVIEFLKLINFENKTFNFDDKINYNKNNYCVNCKFINEINNIKKWIIDINICEENKIVSFPEESCLNKKNEKNENLSLNINENNDYLKKIYVSYIFHEVRNYLNIISLSSDAIISYTKSHNIIEISDNTEFNQLTKQLNDSIDTITDIISDIKKNDKIMKLKEKSFKLSELFNNCVYIFLYQLNNKNLFFEYENNIDVDTYIIADYVKIKQVIINLFQKNLILSEK